MRFRKQAWIERLKRVPLFAGCSTRELEEIASLATEITFEPGKVLMREGEPGREFIVLLEGTVRISQDGREIATEQDGDFFGEIALLRSTPRTATVETTSPVRALLVNDREFRALLERSPEITLKIVDALAARLGEQPATAG